MFHKKKKSEAFRRVLKDVGKACDQSPRRVEKDMQNLLDSIWVKEDDPVKQNLLAMFPNGKPTLEEFVLAVSIEVKKRC